MVPPALAGGTTVQVSFAQLLDDVANVGFEVTPVHRLRVEIGQPAHPPPSTTADALGRYGSASVAWLVQLTGGVQLHDARVD